MIVANRLRPRLSADVRGHVTSRSASGPALNAGFALIAHDVGRTEEVAQEALVAALEKWPEARGTKLELLVF
jgi:predicted RNA polymerase sigma factor